jgi:putative transposase
LSIRPTFKTETALARLLNRLWERTREQIQKIWADGAYAGRLIDWVQDNLEAVLEIVEREEDQDGFEVLPRRWVVERTFAWLGRYRRVSKDYERCPRNSEGMIYLASIHTMAKRLAPDS